MGFIDRAGAPFWGESIPLDYAVNVTGSAIVSGGANISQNRVGAPAALTAGAKFVAGAMTYQARYLEPGDDVVVSWVVVTEAGSSGTLRLASGLDPTYTLDPSYATEPLGDHVVSGASTVVAGTSSFTVADILDYAAEAILSVECVSGSVAVREVMLRVWPPGGPLGAAGAPLPGYALPEDVTYHRGEDAISTGDVHDTGGGASAWSAAWLAAALPDTGTHAYASATNPAFNDATAMAGATTSVDVLGENWTSDAARSRSGFVVTYEPRGLDDAPPALAGLVEGVDWIYPPDQTMPKVSNDKPVHAWTNAALLVRFDPLAWSPFFLYTPDGTLGGAATVEVSYPSSLPPIDVGAGTIDLTFTGSGATYGTGDDGATIPLDPGADLIQVLVSTSYDQTDPAYPGLGAYGSGWQVTPGVGDAPGTEAFTPMSAVANYPAYQLWSPAGAPPETYLWNVRSDGLGRNNLWNLPKTRQSTVWNQAPR